MLTQQTTPAAGIQGTKGVLKLRGAWGCVRRTTITPKQTKAKANKVPMLVISPATLAACGGVKTLVQVREDGRKQTIFTHTVKHTALTH